MSGKRPLTSSLIFFVVLVAALCIWLFLIAPVFQEKERLVRSENAALIKDLAEIDEMNGNTEELDTKIADTEGNIKQKYTSRAETADKAAARIESICAGLGYHPVKIALGQKTLLHSAGAFAPALYSVDITFLIESTEEAGTPVIRGLESYVSADFEVTGFVYRTAPPEDSEEEDEEAAYSGEWIFTATLYFYE